jgi:hypothetical protein
VVQRKLLLVAAYMLQTWSLLQIQDLRQQQSMPASTATEGHAAQTKNIDDNSFHIDAGGYKFTKTRATLCRLKGSLSEAMFSGRHPKPAPRDSAESYIIDCNGTHFEHILHFLRVGAAISLPADSSSKEALVVEAD